MCPRNAELKGANGDVPGANELTKRIRFGSAPSALGADTPNSKKANPRTATLTREVRGVCTGNPDANVPLAQGAEVRGRVRAYVERPVSRLLGQWSGEFDQLLAQTKKCMQSFTEECRRTAAQYESNPRSSKRRSCQQSTAMPATTGGFNRSMQQRDEIAQLESRIAAYSLVVR